MDQFTYLVTMNPSERVQYEARRQLAARFYAAASKPNPLFVILERNITMSKHDYAAFVAEVAGGRVPQYLSGGEWHDSPSDVVPSFESFKAGKVRLKPVVKRSQAYELFIHLKSGRLKLERAEDETLPSPDWKPVHADNIELLGNGKLVVKWEE